MLPKIQTPCLLLCILAFVTSALAEEVPQVPQAAIDALAADTTPQSALALLASVPIDAKSAAGDALRKLIADVAADPAARTGDWIPVMGEIALALWDARGNEFEPARLAIEAQLQEIVGAWTLSAENLASLNDSDLFERVTVVHFARDAGTRVPPAAIGALRNAVTARKTVDANVALSYWVGAGKAVADSGKNLRESVPAKAEEAAVAFLRFELLLDALLVHRRSSKRDDGYWKWARAFQKRLWEPCDGATLDFASKVLAHRLLDRRPPLAVLSDHAPRQPRGDLRAVVTDTRFGPLILAAESEGAAERAGLQTGERIIAVGDQQVRDSGDLGGAVGRHTEAEVVTVHLEGPMGSRKVEVELDRRPRLRRPNVGKLRNPEGDEEEGKAWTGWTKEDFARLPTPRMSDPVDRKELEALAERAFTSLPWEKELGDAQAAAKETGAPIFWYLDRGWKPKRGNSQSSPTYAPQDYHAYLRTTLFHHQTTRELLRRRFVLLHVNPTKEQAERLGILRFQFYDPGWIVLSPDGDKVWQMDRIATYSEEVFDHALRSFLALHPELDVGSKGARHELAEGRLAAILSSRERGSSMARRLDRVEALLRLRRLDDAASELKDALGQPKVGERRKHALRIATISYALATRRGDDARIERCLPIFERLDPAQGMEVLARVAWRKGQYDAAAKLWRMLVTDHAAHPSAAWAASCLLGKAACQHSVEPTLTLDDPIFNTLPTSTTCAYPASDAGELAVRATRSLLTYQSADGSWRDTPYAWGGPQHRPNTIMAITGIAARALLAWRSVDEAGIDAALTRADAYLSDHRNFGETADEKCYAYAYALRYWIDRGNKEEAARLTDKLSRIQSDLAGWGHEYYNPFATATCLESLATAREAGVSVPPGAIDKGRATLDGLRHPAGGFPYGFSPNQATLYASTGRSPGCELAILLAGGGSQDRLVEALDNFFENREWLTTTRQYDFHSDKFANGGFFYWHDMLPVGEAIVRLESVPARERFTGELLEMISSTCEVGGAWCDSQNIGRSYGTGMSLLTLKAILP